MDEKVEAVWSEEIRRRIEAVDSGEERLLDWAEVKERLFSGTSDLAEPADILPPL